MIVCVALLHHARSRTSLRTRQVPRQLLLIHTQPGPPARKYGVCTVLIPALEARLTVNGAPAKGRPFPTQREGRPFSTCALAFSESWTEAR